MNEVKIVVNTWQTRSRPWVYYIIGGVDIKIDVKKLIEKLEKLPTRVNVPPNFTEISLPRYYLITLIITNDDYEVVDIIGVRSYLGYTKWSFNNGYWHPWVIDKIIENLKKVSE